MKLNLPNTMKDGSYVVNLDENKSIETHWIDLYANNNSVTYFYSFIAFHNKLRDLMTTKIS